MNVFEEMRRREKECEHVERFLANMPVPESSFDDAPIPHTFLLGRSDIEAVRKALRMGLAEMGRALL